MKNRARFCRIRPQLIEMYSLTLEQYTENCIRLPSVSIHIVSVGSKKTGSPPPPIHPSLRYQDDDHVIQRLLIFCRRICCFSTRQPRHTTLDLDHVLDLTISRRKRFLCVALVYAIPTISYPRTLGLCAQQTSFVDSSPVHLELPCGIRSHCTILPESSSGI